MEFGMDAYMFQSLLSNFSSDNIGPRGGSDKWPTPFLIYHVWEDISRNHSLCQYQCQFLEIWEDLLSLNLMITSPITKLACNRFCIIILSHFGTGSANFKWRGQVNCFKSSTWLVLILLIPTKKNDKVHLDGIWTWNTTKWKKYSKAFMLQQFIQLRINVIIRTIGAVTMMITKLSPETQHFKPDR